MREKPEPRGHQETGRASPCSRAAVAEIVGVPHHVASRCAGPAVSAYSWGPGQWASQDPVRRRQRLGRRGPREAAKANRGDGLGHGNKKSTNEHAPDPRLHAALPHAHRRKCNRA